MRLNGAPIASLAPVRTRSRPSILRLAICACAFAASTLLSLAPAAAQPVVDPPTPLLDPTHPVQWLFVYKFNASTYDTHSEPNACVFGGTFAGKPAGQAYAVASSGSGALKRGSGLVGTSLNDPVGATFGEIYRSNLNFVVWNDQFYGDPKLPCGKCERRWGHSKGILAWDNVGNGLVLQVTTPDWPGAGSAATPRPREGNTLGCEHETHNVQYGQHFFALKLTPADTAMVLDALVNASVVTNVRDPQIARLGGPADLVARAAKLGQKVQSDDFQDVTLSSGVRLISKPSDLWVPPWQLISARLGSVPLRTSTWRANSPIPTTTATTPVTCWRPSLGKPNAVEIATTGQWDHKVIKVSASGSHGKIGVSTETTEPFTIFGDMNQQGALTGTGPECASAQNGRGGLFFILADQQLFQSVTDLLKGETAPLTVPKKKQKPKPPPNGGGH